MPKVAVYGVPRDLIDDWTSNGATTIGPVVLVEFEYIDQNAGVWRDSESRKFYVGNYVPMEPIDFKTIGTFDNNCLLNGKEATDAYVAVANSPSLTVYYMPQNKFAIYQEKGAYQRIGVLDRFVCITVDRDQHPCSLHFDEDGEIKMGLKVFPGGVVNYTEIPVYSATQDEPIANINKYNEENFNKFVRNARLRDFINDTNYVNRTQQAKVIDIESGKQSKTSTNAPGSIIPITENQNKANYVAPVWGSLNPSPQPKVPDPTPPLTTAVTANANPVSETSPVIEIPPPTATSLYNSTPLPSTSSFAEEIKGINLYNKENEKQLIARIQASSDSRSKKIALLRELQRYFFSSAPGFSEDEFMKIYGSDEELGKILDNFGKEELIAPLHMKNENYDEYETRIVNGRSQLVNVTQERKDDLRKSREKAKEKEQELLEWRVKFEKQQEYSRMKLAELDRQGREANTKWEKERAIANQKWDMKRMELGIGTYAEELAKADRFIADAKQRLARNKTEDVKAAEFITNVNRRVAEIKAGNIANPGPIIPPSINTPIPSTVTTPAPQPALKPADSTDNTLIYGGILAAAIGLLLKFRG